ncbi:DUF7573 domain-containing protein [Haloarchaeobius sp. TZWSO28]|uniref:DUF7573 domain-containing protein n=1 Tax=Haloarchaeobius sp. TZWSO28 TaxID=3446119 RepID=UPI003EC08ACF
MPQDRSLDEFGPDTTSEERSDDDAAAGSTTETDQAPSVSDSSPAVTTYSWTPEGGECASCGTATQRRWRDQSGFVCVDCKEW